MNKKLYLAAATIGAVGYGLLASQGAFAKTAVHTAFEDERFYQCVVTAYNNKEGETKDYQTDILTDAELLKVTSLDCNNNNSAEIDKIASVAGLEKLSSLTSLKLYGNQIEEIDLSKNTELLELDVRRNKLNVLDITKNIKLKTLKVESYEVTATDNNNIQTLDISKNPDLELIKAQGSMLYNDLELVKNGSGYTIDLSNLKFITSGNAFVTTAFVKYGYDQNSRIVSISDITKVSSIHIDTDLNEGFDLFIDKSSLDNNANQDETSGTGSDEIGDEEPKSTESGSKKDLGVPDTGNITNDEAVSKLMPIVLPATIATVILVSCLLKVVTRKKVKF
ncbi:hypothetical protein IKF94_00425 [Candidatus Saccharibacteria bacterium]|nr:hypothetical protein [Candidatus Saccharibacteria bacterium]